MSCKRLANAAVAAALCFLCVPGTCVTSTFSPNKDATIYSINTNGANGASGSLYIGNNAGSETRRTLIGFNLATIPTTANVTAVTLQMVCSQVPGGATAQSLTLQKLIANWSEGPSTGAGSGGGQPTVPGVSGDVTWTQRIVPSNSWTSAGGDFSATVSATQSVTGATSYTWASTAQLVADVQSWVTTPGNNFGWIIRGGEIGQQTVKEFASRESPTATDRPVLSVTYTTTAAVDDWTMY